ncbi:MAG: hypothetical protein IPL87_03030 [Candidatus Moraniibacteriota bacterium]|nr:MAG: hypothetical protein IPL87_03030 [Candidatus Moranbacteria bacterium]
MFVGSLKILNSQNVEKEKIMSSHQSLVRFVIGEGTKGCSSIDLFASGKYPALILVGCSGGFQKVLEVRGQENNRVRQHFQSDIFPPGKFWTMSVVKSQFPKVIYECYRYRPKPRKGYPVIFQLRKYQFSIDKKTRRVSPAELESAKRMIPSLLLRRLRAFSL